jgi:SagB-type dehydrogenase family enzyme
MINGSKENEIKQILHYHECTKHRLQRFARSLGYMDWATQPDPFRRHEGAPEVPLDQIPPGGGPSLAQTCLPASLEPRPLDRRLVSQLFYDSLALSAWKRIGPNRWSLRCNPSSGNLHPTEAYLLCGAVAGLGEGPALYHYSPYLHALERRRELSPGQWGRLTGGLPGGALLVGLSSIHWRESWKYGERAFRYCQHDVGHAVAALAYAAAALGWRLRLLCGVDDGQLERLLGISGQRGPEAEHPDCLLLLDPAAGQEDARRLAAWRPAEALLQELGRLPLQGEPNRLSPEHHDWPVIEEVARAARIPAPAPPPVWIPPPAAPQRPAAGSPPARRIFRQRRSAVEMDGRARMSAEAFFGLLQRLLPCAGGVPFASLPWRPAVHPLLFVHRVDDLDRGLYLLLRDPGQLEPLQEALQPGFAWEIAAGCPQTVPLYRLDGGDWREIAGGVSCQQAIARDGVFAVAMLAEFEPRLRQQGPWAYRQLHWEAGAVGQALYLEAEAAGLRGTGIGCFFDDMLHELVGLRDRRWQTLYHFTVGAPVDDPRLATLDAYHHLA